MAQKRVLVKFKDGREVWCPYHDNLDDAGNIKEWTQGWGFKVEQSRHKKVNDDLSILVGERVTVATRDEQPISVTIQEVG